MHLSRITLVSLNIIFMGGGFWLIAMCVLLSADSEKVLMSQLIVNTVPSSLLYYATMGGVLFGLAMALVSLFGFLVAKNLNSCLLALYLFILVTFLLGESVLVIVAVLCPNYVGISLNEEDVLDKWQRNYAVPGREQYTAAIDLVQTKFECCGVVSSSDFGTSWWKIRELAAPSLIVPLSCCIQENNSSFLDPIPINNTLCQDKHMDKYISARHIEGCLPYLEKWLSDHTNTILIWCLGLIMYQLVMLLMTILVCVRKVRTHTTKEVK